MNNLSQEDFVPFAPKIVGEQIHRHHCRQGKGNDKLYIKRNENGIVAYCFHCGKSGFSRIGVSYRMETEKGEGSANDEHGPVRRMDSVSIGQGPGESVGGRTGLDGMDGYSSAGVLFVLPVDCYRISGRCVNTECQRSLESWGADSEEFLRKVPLWYSPRTLSLIIPQYDPSGTLIGYQARRFPTLEGYPKYLTYRNPKVQKEDRVVVALKASKLYGGPLFLTEDYVSAGRICILGYDALPLFGTQLANKQLEYVVKGWNDVVVMLDNDNSQVRQSQRKIALRLESLGLDVGIARLNTDPKNYKNSDLEAILKEYV